VPGALQGQVKFYLPSSELLKCIPDANWAPFSTCQYLAAFKCMFEMQVVTPDLVMVMLRV